MRKNKNNCSLLPHIREDIHGLSPQSSQFLGWEIKKFDIPKYWQYSMGEGVVVAVIDTGCDIYHDDLKDNLVQGKNFLDPNKDPIDGNGHGTHVSGTIAASNNGLGMVGVAPKTKIMPVKALYDDGHGDPRDIAKAIVWVADRSVDFITMSLGCPTDTYVLQSAVEYASKKGCIVFCAAGNSGEQSPMMYPAKYSNVISIGAIDENLERTNFTCSGEELDFLAPGHNIVSAVPGNRYAIMSGTSMSNPFAVGCASLLLSHNRKTNKHTLKTVNDYIDLFQKYSRHLKELKYNSKKYEGYGILYPVL